MNLPSVGFWIVHIIGGLACGALACGVGAALHKRLRLSHAARNYWLGIWVLAVLPTLAAVVLELCAPARIMSIPATLPLPVAIDSGDTDTLLTGVSPTALSVLPPLNGLLATLYFGGLGIALLRGLLGAWSVRRIVDSARPLDTHALPGIATRMEMEQLHRSGMELRVTRHAMSPFAVRWPRPTIVMPADALRDFSDRQLRLVIRHESAHLSQRDPQLVGLMKLVGALFWFNPFLRTIVARVQMAAELRCDAIALDGDKVASRDFASAYLQTLRMSAHGPERGPVTALTHRDLDGHKLRISHMLNGDPGKRIPTYLRIAFVGSAFAVGSAIAIVQIAAAVPASLRKTGTSINSTSDGNDQALHAPADGIEHEAAPDVRFAFPIASPRITGHFGDIGSIRSGPHRGTDFGARRGTPILAPAAGTVVAATQKYPDGPNYGTVVVLDHGNGLQTLYAHLDGFDVRVGQRVEAGEQIARSGRTGKVTGAHLHMEMLLNGQRIDPESRLQ